MKVKRYMVQDMNEAMIRIKNELGMDAIILNTRKVKRNGLMRFFKKPMLEVVAAVDEPLVKRASVATPQPQPQKAPENTYTKEIEGLREVVEKLTQKVAAISQETPSEAAGVETDVDAVAEAAQTYIDMLKGFDVQESIAKKIIEIVQRQISIDSKNKETVVSAMKVIAREYLGDIKTIDKDVHNAPNIYIFLGPTGVGKTTTLAKIAAKLSLIDGKSVGLITADTYRIAAVEQLKTYSEILGLPLEVVYESGELDDALHKYRDKDYILIDTAGRSHKSKALKDDFDELVKSIGDYTVFLVMSLTTGYKEMRSMIESYHFLDDYRLLFTKLDEASSYGNILNMKVLTGKPLSYFTIGQSVPDDIEDADKEKIINYVFGDVNH
ncbi:flagellar biosynthesis protein FlhF [Fusibacter sp. JL298sf-3]